MIKSDNLICWLISLLKKEKSMSIQCWLGLWMDWMNPYLWGGRSYVSSTTEGTLYIDLIDEKKN
jgi:hypothetical protein